MPALGRHPFFDERSRAWPVRALMPYEVVRKKTIWELPNNFPLDQGSEGACVGFGYSAELAAVPVVIPADNRFAFDLYAKARAEDNAMGNVFDEGASMLAGAKACKKAGHISSYRWAFGVDDVIDTLCAVGPVVIGIDWYSGMYETTNDGLVQVFGDLVGGHCILLTGYWPAHPAWGDVVLWENSWGLSYGVNGRGFIRVTDLRRLLSQQGEACVLVDVEPTRPVPPPAPLTWWQKFLLWLQSFK